MHRRAYLTSALTAASIITAGCSSPLQDDSPPEDDTPSDGRPDESRIRHTDPTTVVNDDTPRDTEKFLEFHGEGIDLPVVGVDPEGSTPPSNFRTTISYSENTQHQSLTQRFAPVEGDGSPLRLEGQPSFTGNPDPQPSVSVSDDGQAAVVEVSQFGDLSDESVFMNLPITQWPDSAHRIVVESAVEVVKSNSLNQTHILEGRLEFGFTAED